MEITNTINIGTLNTRGNQKIEDKIDISNDAMKYNLQILGLTETHSDKEELITIKTISPKDGKTKEYLYYNSGIQGENKYTGVGFIIEKNVKVEYIKRITDRICVTAIELRKEHKMIIINAYAPTLIVSEKKEETRSC